MHTCACRRRGKGRDLHANSLLILESDLGHDVKTDEIVTHEIITKSQNQESMPPPIEP